MEKAYDLYMTIAASIIFAVTFGRIVYLDIKYPLSQSSETLVFLEKTVPHKEAVALALRKRGITLYRHLVSYRNFWKHNVYIVKYWV